MISVLVGAPKKLYCSSSLSSKKCNVPVLYWTLEGFMGKNVLWLENVGVKHLRGA